MVLDPATIDTIHQFGWGQRWSIRKMAAHLHLDRATVRKYLHHPWKPVIHRQRASKLDPFKGSLEQWLKDDPRVSAQVLLNRLKPLGYSGGFSILKQQVRTLREQSARHQAFVRVEVPPGDHFEVDWGHFGSVDYQGTARKLYAFGLVEAHSRRLYLEFTHSQNFTTLARCLLHGCRFMGGVSREIVFDNMATVVLERDGKLVRFNPRFLALAREMNFLPRLCHLAAPWEKGKIERHLRYVRQSFWPLRTFTSLSDFNRQARQWLAEVANQRLHAETRQKPEERFRPDSLGPLPTADPDYRDMALALVHKDLRLHFDGNRYCVPARYIGCRLTVKATSSTVSLYDREREIVAHARCWSRGQTLGAERFEKELLALRPLAQHTAATQRLITLLGEPAPAYLGQLADNGLSLPRQVAQLLELVRHYGPEAVRQTMEKAQSLKAFGADYLANLLYQQHTPREVQPPVPLKDPELQQLATDPLSLAAYDAFILDPGRDS